MSKIIIGIDPGKSGGICIMNDGKPMIKKMPETPLDMANFLRKFSKLKELVCVLEKVGGMPGNGGSAMFNFGKGYGELTMALLLLEIPTVVITPQKWQAWYQIGSTKSKMTSTQWKNLLKARAQQLYPKLDIKLWGADALLIAHYALKNGI